MQAYEQQPKAVQEWLDITHEAMHQLAKRQQSHYHMPHEKGYFIYQQSRQGTIYDDEFTAQVFITFLEQLIKSSDKKIHLVLDNLRVHHAKVVKTWLEDKESRIELHTC